MMFGAIKINKVTDTNTKLCYTNSMARTIQKFVNTMTVFLICYSLNQKEFEKGKVEYCKTRFILIQKIQDDR